MNFGNELGDYTTKQEWVSAGNMLRKTGEYSGNHFPVPVYDTLPKGKYAFRYRDQFNFHYDPSNSLFEFTPTNKYTVFNYDPENQELSVTMNGEKMHLCISHKGFLILDKRKMNNWMIQSHGYIYELTTPGIIDVHRRWVRVIPLVMEENPLFSIYRIK